LVSPRPLRVGRPTPSRGVATRAQLLSLMARLASPRALCDRGFRRPGTGPAGLPTRPVALYGYGLATPSWHSLPDCPSPARGPNNSWPVCVIYPAPVAADLATRSSPSGSRTADPSPHPNHYSASDPAGLSPHPWLGLGLAPPLPSGPPLVGCLCRPDCSATRAQTCRSGGTGRRHALPRPRLRAPFRSSS
jgi:hypothetical protein